MKLQRLVVLLFFIPFFAGAQNKSNLKIDQWVDSVFNSLSDNEKIAQLMVIRAHSNLVGSPGTELEFAL